MIVDSDELPVALGDPTGAQPVAGLMEQNRRARPVSRKIIHKGGMQRASRGVLPSWGLTFLEREVWSPGLAPPPFLPSSLSPPTLFSVLPSHPLITFFWGSTLLTPTCSQPLQAPG